MVADRGGGRPTGQGTRPQTPKQASKQESGSVRADVPFAIPLDFKLNCSDDERAASVIPCTVFVCWPCCCSGEKHSNFSRSSRSPTNIGGAFKAEGLQTSLMPRGRRERGRERASRDAECAHTSCGQPAAGHPASSSRGRHAPCTTCGSPNP